jgi:hypothetical protein
VPLAVVTPVGVRKAGRPRGTQQKAIGATGAMTPYCKAIGPAARKRPQRARKRSYCGESLSSFRL